MPVRNEVEPVAHLHLGVVGGVVEPGGRVFFQRAACDRGEVFRVDSLRECILTHCQWERDYINGETPLVQAVLRLFLSTNNQPMTVTEIGTTNTDTVANFQFW